LRELRTKTSIDRSSGAEVLASRRIATRSTNSTIVSRVAVSSQEASAGLLLAPQDHLGLRASSTYGLPLTWAHRADETTTLTAPRRRAAEPRAYTVAGLTTGESV
jgi:hypothetical protein